jgi:hypothetical protein
LIFFKESVEGSACELTKPGALLPLRNPECRILLMSGYSADGPLSRPSPASFRVLQKLFPSQVLFGELEKLIARD